MPPTREAPAVVRGAPPLPIAVSARDLELMLSEDAPPPPYMPEDEPRGVSTPSPRDALGAYLRAAPHLSLLFAEAVRVEHTVDGRTRIDAAPLGSDRPVVLVAAPGASCAAALPIEGERFFAVVQPSGEELELVVGVGRGAVPSIVALDATGRALFPWGVETEESLAAMRGAS